MKLYNVIQARGLFAGKAQQKTRPSLAYKLMKFLQATDAEEQFFNQRRSEILDEHCEKNEDGTFVKIDDLHIKIKKDEIEICNSKVNELNEVEVDVSKFLFHPLELDELGFEFSISEMYLLEDLLIKEA